MKVKDLIEFLKHFHEDEIVVLNDPIMGWVSGIKACQDTCYVLNGDKSNRYRMLFEDDDKERTKQNVLKIVAHYEKKV